ncbi:MAG: hypothetical protein ABIJ31_04720, partial [Pseudomonadota bacterium]
MKCLIIYGSRTRNTEKVAKRIKQAFNTHGWHCDIYNMEKSIDIENLPFDFEDYDFICAGSGVYWALPSEKVVMAMRLVSRRTSYSKIVPGPKRGMVFATYGGAHLGPKEAEAALKLLEIEIEHLSFKCVGAFVCPGKYVNRATPEWYHGDIRNRPNEEDLGQAEALVNKLLKQNDAIVATGLL